MSGSLNTPFIGNKLCNADGTLTAQGQQFVLSLWNRTGGAAGISIAAVESEAEAAQKTAKAAQNTATTASETASSALITAAAAQTSAVSAQTTAESANQSALQAEADAQTALSATEDVLITSMLTSSAIAAKTAQFLDDVAIEATLSQIWPSQFLQSSQG
ncbi:hypothetical protein JK185_10320 [Gluconobacter wancherniae]|uniref:hypothetical protein n=1 Tax=Gluconobacter wancherniae TaxID=1307955 RepID=UPI001B8C4A58|nr:hypothetical protein [Gluconobacter wancherniae]MBS1063437.1 hypothetical protein [Gluconobacter wancherniae]